MIRQWLSRWLRLRSISAFVGIVAGIASLVAAFNFSEAARDALFKDIRGLTPELMVIRSVVPPEGTAAETGRVLQYADARVVAEALGPAAASGPVVRRFQHLGRDADRRVMTGVYGVGGNARQLLGLKLAEGRFFSEVENQRQARVCVIGWRLHRQLSDQGLLLDGHLRLFDEPFRVIGVMGSGDVNRICQIEDSLFVPVRSLMRAAGGDESLSFILVRAGDGVDLESLSARVAGILHGLRGGRSFRIWTHATLIAHRRRIVRTIEWLVGSMSLLTVFVACVGCANIMVVSVNERVREIGLRMAVGASRVDILGLFLMEGFLLICVAGGVGIAGGYWLTHEILRPLPELVPMYAGWHFTFSAIALAKTLVVLVIAALAGGLLPAWYAVSVDPAQALRIE